MASTFKIIGKPYYHKHKITGTYSFMWRYLLKFMKRLQHFFKNLFYMFAKICGFFVQIA